MRKTVTLTRLAVHDFNRSLRVWNTHSSPREIIELLVAARSKILKAAVSQLALAVVGTLWLQANLPELSLKLPAIELTVPASFVGFLVAFAVFGLGISITNYFMLTEFIRVASNRLFKFDAAWALTLILDGANAWSLPFVRQFRFFSSSKAHVGVGTSTILFAALPFLAVLILIYWTIFSVGIETIGNDGLGSAGGLFSLVGFLLAIYPFAYWALLRFPFKFERNQAYVRWVFLFRLYRRSGNWHPRAAAWLAEAAKKPPSPADCP